MRNKLDPTTEEKIKLWLKDPYDVTYREWIKEMIQKDPKKIEACVTNELRFGTAGLRAKMGPGFGCINRTTIGKATQGVANYIHTMKEENSTPSVMICYDSREHSKEFAEQTAMVFAANNIRAHLSDAIRPTPLCSFGVRHYGCIAGVMITASHNPPEYNGFKVYWADGAQIVSPHDTKIINAVEAIQSIEEIKQTSLDNPLIEMVGEDLDRAYFEAIAPLCFNKEENLAKGKQLHIVYSPFCGAGFSMNPRALKQWGFTNITLVDSQKNPDGTFPTLKGKPNPEYPAALEEGIRTLKESHADIFLATDPDDDRINITVMHHDKPITLSGNQIAIVCLHYLLKTLSKEKRLPPDAAAITTIVSTRCFEEICNYYQIHFEGVLTGFKYIGEKIHMWEQTKEHSFIFGAEESCGFLYGTHARDKDAVQMSTLLSEIALHYKLQGKTLVDVLDEIHKLFGVHYETSLELANPDKLDEMLKAIGAMRKSPPQNFGSHKVHKIEDYQTGKGCNTHLNDTWDLLLPKSNVLAFTGDSMKIILRPSGTEPKVKVYIHLRSSSTTSIEETTQALKAEAEELKREIKERFFNFL